MNSTTSNTQNTNYALIRSMTGEYLIQSSAFAGQAIRDNWDVIVSGVDLKLATRILEIYETAGRPKTATPDFGDLLTYDMTQPIEERVSEFAEEYDLVSVEWQGRVIEAVITFFDEDTVELDGFIEIPVSHFLQHATLIAKADSDCGFITEYTAYIVDQQQKWERIYAVASQTQTGVAA